MHYFGPWADPDGALAKYLEQKDALHAGRKPRPDPAAVTVKDVANAFLNPSRRCWRRRAVAAHPGQLQAGRRYACVALGKTRLVADLDPQDFAALRNRMAKKWGPHRLAVTIQHIRILFKHAFDAGLIPTPVRFGPGFKRPTKKTFRLHRAEQGPKLFTADELAASSTPLVC